MDELEMQKELFKLRDEVRHEFDNIRVFLSDAESSILGCVDNRIYKIEEDIDKRLEETWEEHREREYERKAKEEAERLAERSPERDEPLE